MCHVLDVGSRRRISERVLLSDFPRAERLTCVAFSGGEKARVEGTGSRDFLVAGGGTGASDFLVAGGGGFISLYSIEQCHSTPSTGEDTKPLLPAVTYSLLSAPRFLCFSSLRANFCGGKKILVGCEDGCIRMLDTEMPIASDGAGPYGDGARSLNTRSSDGSVAPELSGALTVAVMPNAGLVVAGHVDGYFSFWRAESGEYVRAFKDDRGNRVLCIDRAVDESLAVSGHDNGIALIWDASTWEHRTVPKVVALTERHSLPVICAAAVSADEKGMHAIVTVDDSGEIRFSDSETGTAMWTVRTELSFRLNGRYRGVSLGGRYFLWARMSYRCDSKWYGTLIDFGNRRISFDTADQPVDLDRLEPRPSKFRKRKRSMDWEDLMEEVKSRALDGNEDIKSRFCGIHHDLFVELPVTEAGHQLADVWKVSSCNRKGAGLGFRHVDCTLWPAGGGPVSAAVSLVFDSAVGSLAAGWIDGEEIDSRRAVVACALWKRSYPAIMHFCPANH